MPIQPLTLTIGVFSGDGQGENPWTLPNAFSSGGSSNLYIDKAGQIRSIDGYTKQNPTPYTTNIGGSAAMIRGLYQFNRITAGAPPPGNVGLPGSPTRQLLFVLDDGVNEWEIWYSVDIGQTGTFIADLGATCNGTIPDFCTFGDQCFITNGVMVPRMWDGTTLTSVGATQLGAPTSAVTAVAGLLNGIYTYRLVPIRGYVGSVPQRKPGSVPSTPLAVLNLTVLLGWAADADVAVTGYELYRTTGSSIDLYLVAYIDGRLTVAYTDVLPDRELISHVAMALVASVGDPPPTGTYFCVPHKGRVFWLATDNFPRRGWWSDPGDPDSVYQDRSYTDFTDAQSLGDRIVGGEGEFNGMLVVWLQKSIWTLSGTGQVINGVIDWRKKRTDATAGAVHHRATAKVPLGAVFTDQEGNKQTVTQATLAFLTPVNDIRLFDGQSDTIISFPKKDTLNRITTFGPYTSCYVDAAHGMIVWVVSIDNGGSAIPNYSIAWNYWFGTWHEWPGTAFGHALGGVEWSAEQNVVLASEVLPATGAYIYHLWSGATQGIGLVAITSTLMTKPIYPPIAQTAGIQGAADVGQEKRLEALVLVFPKDASPTTLTVGFLPPDAADTDAPTFTRTLVGSSRVRVPARQKSTDANPGKYFFGTGWRIKLTATATTGPWTLQAIESQYVPIPGKTR